MKLWDLLSVAQFSQQFDVYVTNIYDQNLPIGKGTRAELMAQEELQTFGDDEFLIFDHLQDEVDRYMIIGSVMVVLVKDKYYEDYVENQYDERYVKTWKREDINSRPYLTSWEVEKRNRDA